MGDARRAPDALLGGGVKLTSRAGESERDFRLRLAQAARESRDAAVEKLRASYAPQVARLTQRVQTAEGRDARTGSGVAAEHADDGVVWRHGAWRAAGPKGGAPPRSAAPPLPSAAWAAR